MKHDLTADLKLLKTTKRVFAFARVLKSLTVICTGLLVAGDIVYAVRKLSKNGSR